jgi:colanic acid/amylovoran biosynthesis glycosyltransferase
MDRGCEVDIYARMAQTQSQLQPDVKKYNLLARTFYFEAMPVHRLQIALKAMSLVYRNFHKNREAVLQSLNIFRFGKDVFTFKLLYSIIPFLDKGPYDIIHCHFGPNGDVGATLKILGVFKSKLITTFHYYDIQLALDEGAGIYDRLFKEGDLFLSIGNDNYRKFISFGLDKKKIINHPVGVDLTKFHYRPQSKDFIDARPLKLLTVARLVRVKALENGIRAIHKLLQECPNLELEYDIIGDGYLREELNKLIQDLSLENIVRLVGPKDQNQVMEAMGESHIFILPSNNEATPVVLMEAQAVGLPVLATAVGDVKEVIVNEKSGFCVPPGDVDALTGKLKYLINHPETWAAMGKIGRKHIEDKFDVNKLNDRLLDVFKQVIDGDMWKTDKTYS